MPAPKARNMPAPKARNMKARGKREAKQSASPLVSTLTKGLGLKGRNMHRITPFQGLDLNFDVVYQGRRAPRLPLALIFRAVGAEFPNRDDFRAK